MTIDADEAEYRRRCAKVDRALTKLNLADARPTKSRWFDTPPTHEDAAEMSPELRAVLRRKWHIMGGDAPKPESGSA